MVGGTGDNHRWKWHCSITRRFYICDSGGSGPPDKGGRFFWVIWFANIAGFSFFCVFSLFFFFCQNKGGPSPRSTTAMGSTLCALWCSPQHWALPLIYVTEVSSKVGCRVKMPGQLYNHNKLVATIAMCLFPLQGCHKSSWNPRDTFLFKDGYFHGFFVCSCFIWTNFHLEIQKGTFI